VCIQNFTDLLKLSRKRRCKSFVTLHTNQELQKTACLSLPLEHEAVQLLIRKAPLTQQLLSQESLCSNSVALLLFTIKKTDSFRAYACGLGLIQFRPKNHHNICHFRL